MLLTLTTNKFRYFSITIVFVLILLISPKASCQVPLRINDKYNNDVECYIETCLIQYIQDTSNHINNYFININKSSLSPLFRSNYFRHICILNGYISNKAKEFSYQDNLSDYIVFDSCYLFSEIDYSFIDLRIFHIDFLRNCQIITYFPVFCSNFKINMRLFFINLYYSPSFYFNLEELRSNSLFFVHKNRLFYYDMIENKLYKNNEYLFHENFFQHIREAALNSNYQ
jgi:hypothetical protein